MEYLYMITLHCCYRAKHLRVLLNFTFSDENEIVFLVEFPRPHVKWTVDGGRVKLCQGGVQQRQFGAKREDKSSWANARKNLIDLSYGSCVS